MNTTPCKLCGKPIRFGSLVDDGGRLTGKKIPLDASAPVYNLDDDETASRSRHGCYVSHFSVCRGIFEGRKGELKENRR